MEWDVDFYEKENGEVPVGEFLSSLTFKDRAKVLRSIQLLEEFGIELKGPHCDHLGDGIYELRAKVSSNIQRVLYFHYENGRFILTHGFTKKTQKTPPREIDLAKKYRADFLKRKKEEKENKQDES